jgi:2-polyprenyl-3-methyl-5-hydroxy-6-metoxy-1,4-benzoquinol methylase
MTVQPIADLDALKTRIRATWMAGDYGSVAALTESAANEFIDRRQIKPNMQVLGVACGTGNLSIPAAKAGADWLSGEGAVLARFGLCLRRATFKNP